MSLTHPQNVAVEPDREPQSRVQRLAAPTVALAPPAAPAPAKAPLDADVIKSLADLGAAVHVADMALIREILADGSDLLAIVQGVAQVAFRGRRQGGEGWRDLCPALHRAVNERLFGGGA